MNKLLLILGIYISCLSCKENTPDTLPNKIKVSDLSSIGLFDADTSTMQVLKLEKPSGIKFETIVEDYYYLPLETTPNSLIGQYRNIELYKNYIYIQDVETKLLYIFDKKGKFISSLGQRGNGPDDLLHLTTFTIDRNKKEVIVYDSFKQEFFFYTLEGNFKRRTATPIRFENNNFGIDQYGQMIVASISSNNPELKEFDGSSLFILDSTLNILKASTLQNIHASNNYAPSLLLRNNNQIAYMSNYTSDFFVACQHGVELKYKFDLSAFENALNKEKLSILIDKPEELLPYYFSSAHILPPIFFTEKHLFFKVQTANATSTMYCYYNKHSNQTISFSDLDNVICNNGLIFSSVVTAHNDYFVGYVTPELLIDHKELTGKFAEEVSFDDNAILVFFKLK